MTNIHIKLGDITQAKVDAIVNAANPGMLGGGGVDGAIHRAAGPMLLNECKKVTPHNGIRCPAGESRITPAGNLAAKFVIHAVGPIYHDDPDPYKTLASAHRSACDLAIQNGCKSIAFPAISCGAYGFPAEEAAKIAIRTCASSEYKTLEIHFYLFDQNLFNLFHSMAQNT